MSHEIQIQSAVDDLITFKRTREEKIGRVRALVGDGIGNLVGNNGVPWVLCRLGGDVNQLVQAYNGTTLIPSLGMPVTLLVRYKEGRVDHYEIERSSGGETWPGYLPGPSGGVVAHHLSHEGVSGGGWDMVNVYPLNVTMLRADPQATPDMTVLVADGLYLIGQNLYYFPGGTSPTFAAPGSGIRYSVLTLSASGTLHITAAGMTNPPVAFALPANEIPIVAVLLAAGQTAITRNDLFDVRPFLSIGAAATTNAILTPPTITTNRNNYNPTGLSTAGTLRLSASAVVNITGLAGGSAGRILNIHNVDVFPITLVSESGSSTAGNRFALPSDVTLNYNTYVIAQYDAVDTRWRVTGQCCGATVLTDMTDSDGTLLLDSDGNQITES